MQQAYALAEYAVSLAERLGFQYSEAYVERTYGSSYALERGLLNGSSSSDRTGIRIRLLKENRMYVFSTNVLDKPSIRKEIEGFRGFQGVETRLSQEKVEKARYKAREKISVDSHDILKDLLAIDKALAEKKYVKYRNLYGGASRTLSYFVNSEGSRITSDIPMVSSFMSIIVSKGRETRQRTLQWGGVGGFELFRVSERERSILEEATNMLRVMEKGVRLGDAELKKIKNVVAAPEITGIASHESVGHPNEADRVFGREAAQAGTSYLNKGNLGLRIGSEHVTLIDDPTLETTNGFYLYDEEGVRARPKVLVENGVQKELLNNREYAYILGTKSNGSSRSESYSDEPLIRMSNTFVKKGDASIEEMIEAAGDGVYIKSFMEWNIDDTRSFARYQGNEAYLIKNGRIDKPVKNFKIEAETLEFWHAVRMVGKDFGLSCASCGKGEPSQGVPVTTGGPTILLSFE